MLIIDPGHSYQLYNLDKLKENYVAFLHFVKRTGPGYPGNLDSQPGTTSQEVLRCLIDRAKYVNHQQPCWQTSLSVKLLRFVIWLYEHRAAKRHGRVPPSYREIESAEFCLDCGHVGCQGGCHAKAR